MSVAAAAAAAAASDDDEEELGAEIAPQSASPADPVATVVAPGVCREDFLWAPAGGDWRGRDAELLVAESAGTTPLRGDVGGTASATVRRAAMGPAVPFCCGCGACCGCGCWEAAAAPPLSGDWAARLLSGDNELAVELGVLHTLA